MKKSEQFTRCTEQITKSEKSHKANLNMWLFLGRKKVDVRNKVCAELNN